MKTKIESDNLNVTVTCPHCGLSETRDVDEARHKFSLFIFEWQVDTIGDEVSQTHCFKCGHSFWLVWDYTNKYELFECPTCEAEYTSESDVYEKNGVTQCDTCHKEGRAT